MSLIESISKYCKRLAVSTALAAGVLASAYSGKALTNSIDSVIGKEPAPVEQECSLSDYQNFVRGAFDGKYDNHNMFHKDSLEGLLDTAHKIYGHITIEVTRWDYCGKAPKKDVSHITLTGCGSAVAVGSDKNGLYLLTANHVVTPPQLPSKLDGKGRPLIKCRVKEVSYVMEQADVFIPLVMVPFIGTQRMSIGPELDVIARNPEIDVALLRTKKEYRDSVSGYNFCRSAGKSSELEPGDFLYLAGFPRNVTKQIVSGFVSAKGNPFISADDYLFVVDAAVNEGISGGPVYALRDGKPELVGIVRSKYPEGIGNVVRIDSIRQWLNKLGYDFWGRKNDNR